MISAHAGYIISALTHAGYMISAHPETVYLMPESADAGSSAHAQAGLAQMAQVRCVEWVETDNHNHKVCMVVSETSSK